MMTPRPNGILVALALAVAAPSVGCAGETDAADAPVIAEGEDALTGTRLLERTTNPAKLLAGYRTRVLYTVFTDSGVAIHVGMASGAPRTLATYAVGTQLEVFPSDEGSVLVHRASASDQVGAMIVVDLASPTPSLTETPLPARPAHAELRAGTLAFSTTDVSGLSDVYVGKVGGSLTLVPGKTWNYGFAIRADGKRVAFASGIAVTMFDVASATTSTTPAQSRIRYGFAGDRLLYSDEQPGRQEIRELTTSGDAPFYDGGGSGSGLRWFARGDGTIAASMGGSVDLVDLSTGKVTLLRSGGPSYAHFQSVESPDGRYVLDYHPRAGSAADRGAVWLHDLGAPSGLVSTRVADGVAVGTWSAGRYQVNGFTSLAGRCRFEGAFAVCTEDAVAEARREVTLTPLAQPDKPLRAPDGRPSQGPSAACFSADSGIGVERTVTCVPNAGGPAVSVGATATDVGGWYKGRFVVDERNPDDRANVRSPRRRVLVDPATGARELAFTTRCLGFASLATKERLFVADCDGITAVR
jgi:hypothetical protein